MTENIFDEGEFYSFVESLPDGRELHHLTREYLGTDGDQLEFGPGRSQWAGPGQRVFDAGTVLIPLDRIDEAA